MSGRFVVPVPGSSTPVRFPPIARHELSNGMSVWTIVQPDIPAFTAMLVIRCGTAGDPPDRPGLASVTSDLLDEAAGDRDAIQIADALARMGAELEVDTGPDATSITVRALTRSLEPALALVADLVLRPRFDDADFRRVRELRVNRLKQLSRSAGAMADRTFMTALFRQHPYGHGALGTTAALERTTVDDARRFWEANYSPQAATLVVGGDVRLPDVISAAQRTLGEWRGSMPPATAGPVATMRSEPGPVLFVERHGAPQAEVRIGHAGPSRRTDAYHALVTLNAVLGGQFTSRINQRLRQEKGFTYGARTSFEFRVHGGVFSCETSVQADASAEAVADVLGEFAQVRVPGAMTPEELARAKASLTRGYVRHFETAGQLVRAASQLALHGLPDDTFDRFVASVDALSAEAVREAAERFIRPDLASIVVVGDSDVSGRTLEDVGRPVVVTSPEF
ncbi:MAG: insulinase family protein [Acidobacteria bacterium]|nr:insulinase family protein [Acidobacteriota bacterium]